MVGERGLDTVDEIFELDQTTAAFPRLTSVRLVVVQAVLVLICIIIIIMIILIINGTGTCVIDSNRLIDKHNGKSLFIPGVGRNIFFSSPS